MRRCRRTRSIQLIVLSLGILVVGFAEAAPVQGVKERPPAFWRLPWGIVSADGATAYVTGADGKVAAVDVATGKVLWTFADPGNPLALLGRRLAVSVFDKTRPNSLRVVLLDGKGKQVWQSQRILFPDSTQVGTDKVMFTSSAWSDSTSLYLVWRASARGRGRGRSMSEEGVVKVILANGRVEMLETEDAPRQPAPKVSADVARAARSAPGPGRSPGRGSRTIAINDRQIVAVSVKRSEETKEAVLLRWQRGSEKALEPIVLVRGASLRAQLSADNRAALVSMPAPWAEDARVWRVYSTGTGKELGHFAERDEMLQLTVVGPRAFYVADGPPKATGTPRPRALYAVDIKTGKVLWGHAIASPPLRERGIPRGRR